MSTNQDLSTTTQIVGVSGHPINVRITGEGQPLLLINGLTRPMSSWDALTDALGPRMIVAFDAPGVGESPNSHLPLSIAQLATLSIGVIDQLGLDRVDVLGFSLGGAVAQELAARYPARVRRLVLAATSCGVGSTLAGWDLRHSAAILINGLVRANPLSTLWRVMAFSSWSSIPFLGAIDAPTLVVCGRDDRVVPLANSRSLANRIRNSALIELADGHDLQEPGPAKHLARVVDEFLNRDTTIAEDLPSL